MRRVLAFALLATGLLLVQSLRSAGRIESRQA